MNGTSRKIIFYLGFILAALMVVNASFDVSDRSNEVKYTIKVYTMEEAQGMNFEGQMVPMVTTYRQKMNCYLPVEKEFIEEKHLGEQERDIRKLLSPLTNSGQSCIYRLEGWWTYEFCFFKHIKQMHQENGKVLRPQDEFILGKFLPGSGTEEENYYSETYTQGTPCDIAGETQRKTIVRFECSPDSPTMIESIREPSTCNYIVTVVTPLICKHPNYRPKKEKIETISCVYTKHQNLNYDDEEIELTDKHESLHATNKRALSRLPKKKPDNQNNQQNTQNQQETGAEKVLHKGKMSMKELESLKELQNLAKSRKVVNNLEDDGTEEVIEIELVDDEEGTIMEKLKKFAELNNKIRKQERMQKYSSQKEEEESELNEVDEEL